MTRFKSKVPAKSFILGRFKRKLEFISTLGVVAKNLYVSFHTSCDSSDQSFIVVMFI